MGIFKRQSPRPKSENNPDESPISNAEGNHMENIKQSKYDVDDEIDSHESVIGSNHSNSVESFGGGFDADYTESFNEVDVSGLEIDEDETDHTQQIFDETFTNSDPFINHHETIVQTPSIDKDYTFEPNRSYFFIFGPRSTGKSVLLMSLYRYLKTQRLGDSIRNINRPTVAHENRGNKLINEFDSNVNEKVFPHGTTGVDVSGLPAHLNFKFIPRKELNKPTFEFCLMDMAGEDLAKIDFQSNKSFPESIRTYIEDLPQKNLRFIYIIDPAEKSANKTNQIQLFNAFINLIDNYNHSNTPILLLISKWDTVSSKFSSVKDYIKNEYAEVWSEITDETRNFDYGKYSIGTVESDDIYKTIDFSYPKNLFNWIYHQHTGEVLDPDINSSVPTKQSWWNRFITNIFN